jgi:hypothetical protein
VEGDLAALVLKADAHYRAAQDCLMAGDWACYGDQMDALEQILGALLATTQEQP